ncbi:MAG: DNA polymerase III subunit gamma/tau [Balneolaceae bacterium]
MSESYRALTRAYRPQTFDDVVSQEHVRDTLQNAIRNNRISHAYMFCGPRGVGKTTMARVLARAVNDVGEDLDGEDLTRTLNIIEMDAASNRSIEDIRALKEVIRVPPQNGRYKIFIIDEVHMLTKEAFNALLKTLEEPPEHAIFIFATTEPHKVLPTILSRVQRFDFKRIGVREIVDRLRFICNKESIEVDEESLHLIARQADGALRDALGMMDQAVAFCGRTVRYEELLKALNLVGTRELFELVRRILERDSEGGLRMVQRLIHDGVDIQEFLVSLTDHLRNLYVATHSGRLGLIEASDEMRAQYVEQANALSEEDWMRMLHLVSQTQLTLRDARQPVIQFEILLLKLIHMGRAQEIATLIDEVRELKKKGIEPVGDPDSNGQYSKPDTGRTDPSGDHDHASAESEAAPSSVDAQGDSPDESSRDGHPVHAVPDADKRSEPAQSEEVADDPAGAGLDGDNLFGRPSLGSDAEESSVDTRSGSVEQSPESASLKGNGDSDDRPSFSGSDSGNEDDEAEHASVERRPLNIDQVVEQWDQLLELAEQKAPRMLYFQLQRVQCRDLTGNQLEVEVENEFASRLLDENQELLSQLLARVLGRTIRVKGIVTVSKEPTRERMSPYERFQEIQKKDPTLKKIVELFGAELEY